jgi:hypothetical protein
MLIQNYPIKNKNRDLEVDIEISNIQWENNSIGWYEYGSQRCYDHQPDYVDGFDIDEIYLNGKKIHHKKLHELLCKLLENDDSLREKIEAIAKSDAEDSKLDRLIAQQEARYERSMEGIL